MAHVEEGIVDRPQVGAVGVRPVHGPADLADALAVLDLAETQADGPLVDEAERHRLERAAEDGTRLAGHHHAVVADLDGACSGYAGLTITDADTHAVGDVVVPRGAGRCAPVLVALLHAVDGIAREHDAHGTRMWIRQSEPDDVVAAVAAGYAVDRRLAVLGRDLPAPGPALTPADDGVTIRPATAADRSRIVRVLSAAYVGSPDAGWDDARYAEAAARAWYRDEDVLLAERDDQLLGLHWTKRRDATTGEVHNLAVDPAAQGERLGRRLLAAGLAHLADEGCDRVLLWVDLANEAAVRLYVTEGFTSCWEDVAFVRHVRDHTRHGHPTATHHP